MTRTLDRLICAFKVYADVDVVPELSCTIGVRTLHMAFHANGAITWHQWVPDDLLPVDGYPSDTPVNVHGECAASSGGDEIVRLLRWAAAGREVQT